MALAVLDALRYAREQGVLVVAAAGNRRAGLPPTGALFPAAWERGDGPGSQGKAAPPPVYAVGGLETEGEPLANARPGGAPPRAAYADHAVVESDEAGRPTAILTGSSVAAAVVSSAAAVVWHHRPAWSAAEVMRTLEEAGDALDRGPDFPLLATGPEPPRIRRISLCRALERACAAPGPACPAAVPCPPWQRTVPDLAGPLGAIAVETTYDLTAFTDLSTAGPPLCQRREIRSRHPKKLWTPDPCPGEHFLEPRAVPWMYPQPESDPCPSCALVPIPTGPPPSFNAQLKVRLRDDWEGPECLKVSALDVDPRGAGGKPLVSYVIDREVCKHQTVAIGLSLDPSLPPLPKAAVTLHFEMGEGESKVSIPNEVFVSP